MAMSSTSENGPNALFHYNPNLTGAILFIALFTITTLIHAFQLFRTRTWYLIPLIIGGLFEIIGYVGRLLSHTETPNWSLGIFIMQSFTILLAPTLFSASIYMGLGRIIRSSKREALCVVRVNWLTKIFVLGDIFSFLIQGQGAGIQAKKPSNGKDNMHAGSIIIVGGLLVQLLFFALFVLVALIFDRRVRRSPSSPSYPSSQRYPYHWYKYLLTLYAASFLIFVRNVFRVVEYVQGSNGYILRHDWFLYVFDATMMFTLMTLFNYWHPSEVDAVLKGGKFWKGLFRLQEVKREGEGLDMDPIRSAGAV